MPDQDPKIRELEERLDRLVRTQIDFQKEISLIRGEIVRLRASSVTPAKSSLYERVNETSATSGEVPTVPRQPSPPVQPPVAAPPHAESAHSKTPSPDRAPVASDTEYSLPRRTAYRPDPVLSSATTSGDAFSRFVAQYTDNARENLEKFIGENLISLIGIVVLILGVGIGAKYAIDNNLISPLARIIVAYVFGFGLVGLAIKSRRTYTNFSAVLISGGMAIMYFVTYFAYSPYALISQMGAFALMVMFTILTVTAALAYNRQVIAHIGLVGAYAVPFLLSNDTGNYLALFGYMSVINAGILAVSVKKNWTPIFYTASVFTWAIFGGWLVTKYSAEDHFYLAIIFLGVLFAILYGTKVAQTMLLGDDEDRTENLVSSTVTAAIFYGLCFIVVLKDPLTTVGYATFFTYLAIASIVIIGASLKFYKHVAGFYASMFFTWAIFCSWLATAYSYYDQFHLSLIFLGVFFVILYAPTLYQTKFVQDENERTANLIASVVTGIVFYVGCFFLTMDPVVESSRYSTLFTYIAIGSIAILATSFKFFDRVFMYLVVPAVWAIYGVWFMTRFNPSEHFAVAAIFATLFFGIIYFAILFHRLSEDNFSLVEHTSLVLSNAFIFFGFGYQLLDSNDGLRGYVGLFTVGNGLLHLLVAFLVRTIKSSAADVVQVLTILVLTFASIAIPVQFDGNFVTLIWATEAAILFWFGRTRQVSLFEYFSYPVMVLATGSMFLDWWMSFRVRSGYQPGLTFQPLANGDFVTAAIFVAAFAFIYKTNRDDRFEPAIQVDLVRPLSLAIGAVGTFVLYNMFRLEIENYFHLRSLPYRSDSSIIEFRPYTDVQRFNLVSQLNYTLLFLSALAAANLKRFRSSLLAYINSGLGSFALVAFSTMGMWIFYELRVAYLADWHEPVFTPLLYVAIRPISYLFAAVLIYWLYKYSRDEVLAEHFPGESLSFMFEGIAYSVVFIVASCELVNLMAQFSIGDATKLGLSILWGIYALLLIVIGIARDKKHLRIAAFVLLGITLIKLFLYDIADLDTIPKTILFVTLGITLLVVSFLYNKYKDVIVKKDSASS